MSTEEHATFIQRVVNACVEEEIVVRAQPHLDRARVGIGRTINHNHVPMETNGEGSRSTINGHVGDRRIRGPPPPANATFGAWTPSQSTATASPYVTATGIPDTVAASAMTPWDVPTTTSTTTRKTTDNPKCMNARPAGMSDSDEHMSPEPPIAQHYRRRRPAPRHYRRDPVMEVPASGSDNCDDPTSTNRTRTVCDITHVWYRWGLLPPDQNYDTCTSPSTASDGEDFASLCATTNTAPLTPRTLEDIERNLPQDQTPVIPASTANFNMPIWD